jgi:hypothetical protein
LINICVAAKTQRSDSVIMGFESHALSIFLLIRMSGYHRAILRPADLTW